MRQFGILLFSSTLAAACASSPPPEAASSATVAQATDVPNSGPDFSPASADGLATAPAVKRTPSNPTQSARDLNPPAVTATNAGTPSKGTADNTSGTGADGSAGVAPPPGNAAASPAVRPAALTPMDQGPSDADRTVTMQIRQAVMHDKSLSFAAKNVKIITINGKVTLRGAVKTDAERATIEAAARNVAGGAQVDSQIEVSK